MHAEEPLIYLRYSGVRNGPRDSLRIRPLALGISCVYFLLCFFLRTVGTQNSRGMPNGVGENSVLLMQRTLYHGTNEKENKKEKATVGAEASVSAVELGEFLCLC